MKIPGKGIFIRLMNKKIIITLLLVVFISVIMPIVSAQMDYDNVKGDLIIDETTSQYGKIEIKDWFGLQDLASIEPKRNTDTCDYDCSAEIQLNLYQDGVLIDDIKFLEKQNDGSWIDTTIESYQFYIKTGGSEWLVDDYKKDCSLSGTYYLNGTEKTICKQIKSGSHYENNFTWEKYNLGDELKAGDYYVKLEGKRNSAKWIDWQITIQGKLLDEFLVWGEYISSFDTSAQGVPTGGVGINGSVIVVSMGAYHMYNMSGSYIKEWFASEPTNKNGGTTANETNWFIIDSSTSVHKIYKYDMNLNYISQCTISDAGTYYGVAVNKSNFWVVDIAGREIVELNLDCSTVHTIAIAGTGELFGIAMNGSNVFVLDRGNGGVIWSYDFAGNRLGNFSFTPAPATNIYAAGLGLYGEYFYVSHNSDAEVYKFYNAPYTPPFTASQVTTTLNSPIDYYNSTSKSITFNCSANTTSGHIANISLWLNITGNWILNQTVVFSSGSENSIQVTKNIPEGLNYKWTCIAYDNSTSNAWATNRTFTVDTILPLISANILNPVIYVPSDNITVNYTITDLNLASCWYNYNSINISFACLSGINNVTNITSISPNTIIMLYANDTAGNHANYTLNFSYDITPPSITINRPQSLEIYGYTGKSETLNWTASDDYSLNKIWYNYNGTNYTLTGSSNTTIFYLKTSPFNLTVWGNDSLGNTNKTSIKWGYKIFELNQSYSNETNEGSSVNFYAYVVINETVEISSAVLNYNNTQYSGSINNLADYSVISKTNLITPEIAANTTFPFYWTLTLDDSTIINLTTYNQTVYNLNLDNCTVYGNKLFNLTIKDEKLQTNLDNATLEIAINLYTFDKSELLISLGAKYFNQNSVEICSNLNLSSTNYYMEAVMKYYSNDYAREYYNVETFDFTLQNISLYDLNSSESTAFKLTFTGIDFLPEEGVLVYVERQYIDENVFKTVELPKTDTNGQTVIHLVRNDVIYNLIFIKDGTILRRFENLRAFCDDFSIGDCKINLNALSTADDIFTYDEEAGIIYTNAPTYNSTTNIVSFTYVSSDGTSKNVTMNVERRDVFGNNSVCSNTLSSISGTVSCSIGSGITDTTLVTIIQVDGQTWISTSVQIDTTAYGGIGYVAWFLLALGLVFMFSKDKNGILIALLLSYAGAVSMGWVLGGIAGLGSAGIWILIITVVGLWRLNKNKFS